MLTSFRPIPDWMLLADAMWVARSLLGWRILVLMTGLGETIALGVLCFDEFSNSWALVDFDSAEVLFWGVLEYC